MEGILDMQDLRHLNLFSKITRVNTRYLFKYNNMLIFFVPKRLIKKAVGENAKNLRKISEIIKKKIRVVPKPKSIEDAKKTIEMIINPVTFNELEITENEIIVNAGKMNKAALIGRDKRRLQEMKKIIKAFFNRDFKVV